MISFLTIICNNVIRSMEGLNSRQLILYDRTIGRIEFSIPIALLFYSALNLSPSCR